MPEYLIHDNGGRPFKVVVSNNHVIVYKQTKEEEQRTEDLNQEIEADDKAYDKKMKRLYSHKLLEWKNVVRVFIGHHPPNVPKSWLGDFVSVGNSIILHVQGKTYVSIGRSIEEFEAEEPITEYLSEVGNNDVPYPIALSPNYAYLMVAPTLPQIRPWIMPRRIQRKQQKQRMKSSHSIVRLKRNYIPNKDWSDVYAYFYGHKSIPGLQHLTRRSESNMNLSKKYAVVFSEINEGQQIATRELQGRFW